MTIDNDSLLVKPDVAARILEGVPTHLAPGTSSQGGATGGTLLAGFTNVGEVPAAACGTVLGLVSTAPWTWTPHVWDEMRGKSPRKFFNTWPEWSTPPSRFL